MTLLYLYLYACHLFVLDFSQKYIRQHFAGAFSYLQKCFLIMKHHQVNEKSFTNLEYYLLFQLQFVKKWLVYFLLKLLKTLLQKKPRIATSATLKQWGKKTSAKCDLCSSTRSPSCVLVGCKTMLEQGC